MHKFIIIYSKLNISHKFSHFLYIAYCSCIEANLNGIYQSTPLNNNYVGIIWERWLGDYSLKATKMMIRPKIKSMNLDDGSDINNSNAKPVEDP